MPCVSVGFSDNGDVVAIGFHDGTVVLLRGLLSKSLSHPITWHANTSHVKYLWFMADDHNRSLLSSGFTDGLRWWSIESDQPPQLKRHFCPPPRSRAHITCWVVVVEGAFLFCGDSMGAILVYDLPSEEGPAITTTCDPLAYIQGAHAREIVSHASIHTPSVCHLIELTVRTLVVCVPLDHQVCHVDVVQGGLKHAHTLLVSVGHDGRYNLYDWTSSSGSSSSPHLVRLWCILSTPFTTFSTPTKVYLDHNHGPSKMIVSGFLSSTLILWDEYRQSPITTLEAGGFRRPHDIWLGGMDSKGGMDYSIVFASPSGKSSVVYHQSCSLKGKGSASTSPTTIIGGLCLGQTFHSRTVNCAIWLTGECFQGPKLLVTGSEDRTMRIMEYDDKGDLTVKQTLRAHSSSVRALSTSHHPKSPTLILFSGGGQLGLCVWAINPSTAFVELWYQTPTATSRRPSGSSTIPPDHRIMTLDSWPVPGDQLVHTLVVGDSEGQLSLYKFSEDTRDLKMYATCTGDATGGAPILCTAWASLMGGQVILLVTGTTMGDVVVWDISSGALVPVVRYQAHAMGTNSLSVRVQGSDGPGTTSTSLLLCSGGDDQAVCLAQLTARDDSTLQLRSVIRQDGASYSAIKTVRLFPLRALSGGEDCGIGMVSVGCDQRLHVWQILRVLHDTELQRVSSEPQHGEDLSAVPATAGTFMKWLGPHGGAMVDINDVMSMDVMECIENKGGEESHRLLVLVCGDGIEVISFNHG